MTTESSVSSLRSYEDYRDVEVIWGKKIPSDWQLLRSKFLFQEIVEKSQDGTETLLSVSEYSGVSPRKNLISDGDHLSRSATLEGYKKCLADDLVINIMLAWKRGLGIAREDGIVSPAYCVFRPDKKNVNPRFAHYLLRSEEYITDFRTRSTGIIDSRLRMYPEDFGNVPILLPSMTEQTSIANFLDLETGRIDGLVEKQQRLIDLLEEKRTSLISQVVTKGLNPDVKMKPSGIEWLGDVPEGWEVKRYRHVLSIQQGMAFKSSDYVVESRVISVRMGNIKKGGLIDLLHNAKYLPDSFATEYADYQLHEGDLLIAMTDMSPSLEFLAVPAFMKNLENDSVYLLNQRVGKVIVSDSCDSGYLKYLLLSESLREQLKATGLGTVQANMSSGDLYSTFLAIPSTKQEQQKICDYLDFECAKIDKLIALATNAVDKLNEYRTSLISAAVTGKIDVRNHPSATPV